VPEVFQDGVQCRQGDFRGAAISIPIAWPSAVKSMTKPGSTLRVRALF
jgi:hypothetical protein